METKRPLFIAHRGAMAQAPENTLEAFEAAFNRYGCDMVELDVRLTQDEVPVIIHDSSVDRTTNGTGFVSGFQYSEIRALDAGYYFNPEGDDSFPKRGSGIHIPSLEEVLRRFQGKQFAIEIKDKSAGLVHQIMELVMKYEADKRVIVGSKHDIVARELKEHFGEFKRFCSQKEVLGLYFEFSLGLNVKNTEDPLLVASLPIQKNIFNFNRESWIRFLHDRKIEVFYWDIKTADEMASLAANGADGLIVNNPEDYIATFKRRP